MCQAPRETETPSPGVGRCPPEGPLVTQRKEVEAWVAEPSTTVGRKPALPPRLPGPQVGVEAQSRKNRPYSFEKDTLMETLQPSGPHGAAAPVHPEREAPGLTRPGPHLRPGASLTT